jgi:stage II sporulation protein M
MGRIKDQYSQAWYFCSRKILPIFLGTLGVAVGLSVLFTLMFEQHADIAARIVKYFVEQSKDIIVNGDISCGRLFLNNLEASGMAAIIGFVPFLFLPAISLLSNTAVIGAVFSLYSLNGNSISRMFVFGILPHGIFEITAIVLSISMGIFLCYTICCLITGTEKQRGKKLKETVIGILRSFICFVVPLLIAAAVVETYVTPLLIDKFV